MTRYYLHVRDGAELRLDKEGAEFLNIIHAHDEAVLSAQELMGAKVCFGDPIKNEAFEITDETGAVVDVVPFRSILNFV